MSVDETYVAEGSSVNLNDSRYGSTRMAFHLGIGGIMSWIGLLMVAFVLRVLLLGGD